ncbi:SRPBCC family protein [Streptomyces sp. NPDC048603]|uniref:SRPBCC family protein n=1 Tax=Streptomyces sp. NPDC048603 TaxID=3365577 RepID=UPI003711F21E
MSDNEGNGTAAVTRISHTLTVNDPADPGQPRLTRDQVWAGLVAKARDPRPYLAVITECTVLAETPQGLLREVVAQGERFREEVEFDTGRRVAFRRTGPGAAWTILNVIGEDDSGALTLTFTGEFGYELDEPEAERARAGMVSGVTGTLAAIRRNSTA